MLLEPCHREIVTPSLCKVLTAVTVYCITQSNKDLDFSTFIYVFFATEFENHIRVDVKLIVFYLCLISYFLDISASCYIDLF